MSLPLPTLSPVSSLRLCLRHTSKGVASPTLSVLPRSFAGLDDDAHRRKLISQMGRLTKIEAKPEQSKHLETATAVVCGLSIDWVQQRGTEIYTADSRIPTVVRAFASFSCPPSLTYTSQFSSPSVLHSKMPVVATSPSTPSSITSTPNKSKTKPGLASKTLASYPDLSLGSAPLCSRSRRSTTTRFASCELSGSRRDSGERSSSTRSWWRRSAGRRFAWFFFFAVW